jgi:hypothetical protein
MAATFLQLATIAQSQSFQQRVNFSMNKAAAAIYNEGAGVTNHSARAAYAIKVANGNFNLGAAAMAVATAAAIVAEAVNDGSQTNAILDADIDNSVASLWNMLAGV